MGAATVLTMSGCSGGGGAAAVSGIVTYNDVPLDGGTVNFFGQDGKSDGGPIGADGSYSLRNVPIGECVITVTTPPPVPKSDVKDPVGDTTAGRVSIPADYGDKSKKLVTYTVTAGNQTHNIDLKKR